MATNGPDCDLATVFSCVFMLISGLEPLIYLPTNVDISGLLLVPEPLPKGGGGHKSVTNV